MAIPEPDLARDVIVRHLEGDPARGEQWAVFLGPDKRVELSNQEGAFVFARLLADLQQRRIWLGHGDDGDLSLLERGQLRGCSCC